MKQLLFRRNMSGSTTSHTASLSKTAEIHEESPATTPRSENHPVDLDELYEQKQKGHGTGGDGGSAGGAGVVSVDAATSSSVSGDITETTVSHETPEKQRMSALIHTMAEKQLGISEAFCGMIHSMSKLVVDATATAAASDSNDNANEPSKSKSNIISITKRAKKCKEFEEQAVIMANKQARIAQQFEALVFRLEQEAIDREAANQRLTRQLHMARMMLKEEAGIVLADMDVAEPVPPRSPSKVQGPPKTVRPHHSRRHSPSQTEHPSSVSSEIFSIKEISFCHTVVDVGEMTGLEEPSFSHDSTQEETPQEAITTRKRPTAAAAAYDNLRLIL